MTQSLDERDALYGLVAKSVRVSADKLTYRFLLRPEGALSRRLQADRAGRGLFAQYSADQGASRHRATAARSRTAPTRGPTMCLVVRFAPGARATCRSSSRVSRSFRRPITRLTTSSRRRWSRRSAPAPIRSARSSRGASSPSSASPTIGARILPVNVGQSNFDVIQFEYFGDRQVAFEAFKAGAFTEREEFTSPASGRRATIFRPSSDGRVKRVEIPDDNISGIQGWFFNTRRTVFADPRVREAIGYAFDFEWTNHNLMYDAYKRITSYFENSPLCRRKGLPSEAEKALLEPFRDKLPAEVFRRSPFAAGLGRLGPGPHSAAQGHGTARGGRLRAQGQCAATARRHAARIRISRLLQRVRAAHATLHQES